METLSLTALRQNIFQVADHVLETGEAVIIERHGQRLVLAPERAASKLDKLPRRDAIVGDPEDLVELKPWNIDEWHEADKLA